MNIIFKSFRASIKRYILMMTLSNILLFLSSVVFAQTMNKDVKVACSVPCPWSITAQLGYANYSDMYHQDGQTALGRFSIGRDLVKTGIFNVGLEAGIQNGNIMRLNSEDETALISHVSARPIMDLLLTVKTDPLSERLPVFTLFKVGAAYQRWVFSGVETIDDKTQMSLEGQLGLGYWINDHTNISLSYQRIFGATPDFHSRQADTTYITHIPTQQAVLFGISMSF